MNRYQSKASKLLNDFLKENQRRRDTKTLKEAHERTKPKAVTQHRQLNNINIEYCGYCNKAFSDSKCLMKHLLRRHSDDLLHMHSQFVKTNCKQKKPIESGFKTKSTSISTCIGKEVAELKKMLRDFKVDILEQLQLFASSCSGDNTRLQVHPESSHKIQKQQKCPNDLQKFCTELQELKLQCQHFETIIQSVEEKYKISLESAKQEIALNEENRERSDAEIRKTIRNTLRVQKKEVIIIKEELEKQLAALRQVIFHEMQKQYSDLDAKLTNLESKHLSNMEMLHLNVEQSIARLEKAQADYNIEEIFEKHLKTYLKKIYKEPKRKHNKTKTFLHSSAIGDLHQVSHLEKLSIPNIPQTLDESRPMQGTSQKLCYGQPGHIENESPFINYEKQSTVPNPSSKKARLRKPLFITKRIKALLQDNPNILEEVFQEVLDQFESKMRSYGLHPGQSKLSISEFQTKKMLIYNNLQIHGKQDFFTLRNKIDNLVTKKVKSYLSQNKKSRKGITFATPEFIVQTTTNAGNSTIQKPFDTNCGDANNANHYFDNVEDPVESSKSSEIHLLTSMPQETIGHGDQFIPTFPTTLADELPRTSGDKQDSKVKISNVKNIKSSSSMSCEFLESHALIEKPNVIENNVPSKELKSSANFSTQNSVSVRRELNFNEQNIQNFDSVPSKMYPLNHSDSMSSLDTLSNFENSELDTDHIE